MNFRKLQLRAELDKKQIEDLLPNYSRSLISKWRAGTIEAPKNAINIIEAYISYKAGIL